MHLTVLAGFAGAAVVASWMVAGAAQAGRVVTLSGGGWGHGLGMSQYGAYQRGYAGTPAAKILTHYYPGTAVVKEQMPHNVRVGLLPAYGGSISSIPISSKPLSSGSGEISFTVEGDSAPIARGGPSDRFRIEASPTGGMRLYKNGARVDVDGNGVFGGENRAVVVHFATFGSLLHLEQKGRDYAYGTFEVSTYKSGACSDGYCVRGALSLSMQKYLYGLGEVPASWPQQTLRAQAIAGRTYAYKRVLHLRREGTGQHRYPCDCALYDSTLDQAYIGDSKRTGSGSYWDDWKLAVDATGGQVIEYGGAPITALYMSSSGGHTESVANVWGSSLSQYPYLRGVRDRADYAHGVNPNYRWKERMPWSDFAGALQKAGLRTVDSTSIGTITGISVVPPKGVSGRITVVKGDGSGGLRITGSNGVARESGWWLRSVLDLRDIPRSLTVRYTIGDVFQEKYRLLNGRPGAATGSPYDVPRGETSEGRAQDFEVGRMTYTSSAGKVTWQWGPVLRRYDGMGREGGPLGMPATDVWGTRSYKGAGYRRGLIIYSASTGSHAVLTGFRTAYIEAGGAQGLLGLPITGRKASAAVPDGGRYQRFERGTLYQRKTGAPVYALWGKIDAKYRSMGMASSPCGYPTADLKVSSSGQTAVFEHGTMTHKPGMPVRVPADVRTSRGVRIERCLTRAHRADRHRCAEGVRRPGVGTSRQSRVRGKHRFPDRRVAVEGRAGGVRQTRLGRAGIPARPRARGKPFQGLRDGRAGPARHQARQLGLLR